MSLLGPAQQSPNSIPPKALCVSSGPVTLDIRPVSAYQQQLVDSILSLRSQGWTDRQIANYFNESGYLTPRGKSWISQSVYSIRVKFAARRQRVGSDVLKEWSETVCTELLFDEFLNWPASKKTY